MNHFYLLLTQEFAEAMNGHQEGPNIFGVVQTADGRWVCSANSLNEFPNMFSSVSFQVISLSASDFLSGVYPIGATYTLSQLKAHKVSLIERLTREYMNSHYDAIERDALQMIFSQALATQNEEAATRVGLVMEWAGSVMGYNSIKIAEVKACVNQAELGAVIIDFSQFDATDPNVSTGEFLP